MSETNIENRSESREAGIGFHLIVFLLSLPISMIAGRWMPEFVLPIGDGYSLHGILSILVANLSLQLILYPLRGLINVVGIIGGVITLFMLWNGNLQKEDLRNLFYGGTSLITKNKIAGRSISHETEILRAIGDDSGMRQFVDENSSKYLYSSNLDPSILKSFAIFDIISNPNWKYKEDPKNRELFRPVSETIKTKLGDCDDYAICLAACMKYCDACVRIVHAHGHLYPQLYVGHTEEKTKITQVIRRLYPKSRWKEICFSEENNKLWLNMDYSATHPGGKKISLYDFEFLELCEQNNR